MTLRVVQWATGPVGRHAMAAVVDHPDLELVGCFVYDESKAGRDAGELAGLDQIGVIATRDREAILALDADCVLFMAQGDADPAGALADICPLLASGKNVISTAVTPLIYPSAMGDEVVQQLELACSTGVSSFHATGLQPGWAAEALPMLISGLLRSVDSLTVREVFDYASYDNAFMLFDVMGFGHLPESTDYIAHDPSVLGGVFRAPIMLVADALGATIDDWTFTRDVRTCTEPFRIAAGPVEGGTIAAVRFGATAIVDGRPALSVEHVTRIHPDVAPDWPTGRGWRVTVDGVPSVEVSVELAVNGEDENDQTCIATAMHAIHAVAPVCAAEPGIRTFLDLKTILGRHVLSRPHRFTDQGGRS